MIRKSALFLAAIFVISLSCPASSAWYTWAQIWGKDETVPVSAINNISRCRQEKLIELGNVLQMGKDTSDLRAAVTAAHAAGLKIIAQVFANSFPADQDKQALIDAGAELLRYDGTPYYSYGYFCGNQPAWREYLKDVVIAAVSTEVDGFCFINGNNEDGRCFCSSCEAYFRDYLSNNYTTAELAIFGITDIDTFDYSDHLYVRGYHTNDDIYGDFDKSSIPLLTDYKKSNDTVYLQAVNELVSLARTHGKSGLLLMNSREGPAEATTIKFTSFEAFTFYTGFDVLGTIFSYKEKSQAAIFKYEKAMFPTAAIVTQPVDLSLGGIVTNTADPEKYIYGCIAEALANKVSYYDVHDFGLWNNVWLDWSIDPAINLKIKEFLQNYNAAFNFDALQSCAKIGVLYSSKTQLVAQRVRPVTAWQSFTGLGRALSKSGFQYDVIFNGDGELYPETISAALLSRYEIVILPGIYALTGQERSALLSFASAGGTLIAYGEIDPALSLSPGESTYGSGKIYYDSTKVPKSYAQTGSETIRATIEGKVEDYLSSRVVSGISQTYVNQQVWKTADPDRVYLHLVNHDIENTLTNLTITLEIPSGFGPDKLYLTSPDLTEQELNYTQSGQAITFTVPELDVWNLLILTSTEEAEAAEQRDNIINSLACGPNPATSSSTIMYNLAEPAAIKIRLYSLSGNLIKVLTDAYTMGDAVRSTVWNLDSAFGTVSNGVYIYIFEATSSSGKVSRQRGKIIVYK